MIVSVVIAALDEAQTVAEVVRAARRSRRVHEIIVVSDGSRDRTGAVARQAGADVIELPRNVGKAGAVMAGVVRAAGDIVVLLDADLIGLRPEHIEELLHPVLEHGADMVIGRFRTDLGHNVMPSLSGQRAIPRFHLLRHQELSDKGFGLERALAAIAKRERWRVRTTRLSGVTHRRKEEKYGFVRGYRAKLRAAEDFVRNGRPHRRRWRSAAFITSLFVAPPSVKDLAPMPAPTASDRILLAVAHNDDELIAAGGYLAAAHEVGSAIKVVILTNGDANRLSAALLGRQLYRAPNPFILEGGVRQQESIAALGRLRLNRGQIVFLGFPDRGLASLVAPHWSKTRPYTSPFTRASAPPYSGVFRPSARYTGEDLVESLADIIAEFRPTVLLTHSSLDRHADHRATADFVSLALDQASPMASPAVKRFGFVIHAHGFPRPLRFIPHSQLGPPPSLRDEARWMSFPLSASAVSLKADAMRLYRTQHMNPYLRLLLRGFIRRNELFIEEPVQSGAD